MQIEFNGKTYPFKWWNGEQLRGTVESPLAFDVETQAIPPYRCLVEGEDPTSVYPSPLIVPELALSMACDGSSLYLVHPNKISQFITKNKQQQWVGHNFPFDFWVLMKYARDHKNALMEEFLWQMGDNNKFSDTAILDLLLQLGTGKYRYGGNGGEDKKLFMANLGMLAEEWKLGEMDKEDPYRLRFGELIGLSEEQITNHPEFRGFVDYALKDVIVTHQVYPKQRAKGIAIMTKVGWTNKPQKTYEIAPNALKDYGCLSEYIQVKGAIALAELSRTPIYIDEAKRADLEKQARQRYANNMNTLLALEPTLFKRYSLKARNGKGGQIRYNKKTRLPEMSNKVLATRLAIVAKDLNVDPPISTGIQENISLSTKDWFPIAEIAKDSEGDSVKFLKSWCGLGGEVKLMSFLLALKSDDGKVYSNYNLLMRTGRTSASAHRRQKTLLCPSLNIQQLPREDEKHPERSVRTLFIPPKGYKWGSFDYGYIELCALAAVCRSRYGFSKLGDAIEEHRTRGGFDPHETTAMNIMGLTKEQYLALDKETRKQYRQNSKACSFGYMGGLGISKFITYAKQNYRATFTKKTAKETKNKWLDAYNEMRLYLDDPNELIYKWQTGLPTGLKLGWVQKKRLSDYLKKTDREREQEEYSQRELDGFWEILNYIAKYKNDNELLEDCKERRVTARVRNLITYRSCVLTGRVRNLVTYTANCNTSVQGLAADGAKLTLWKLLRKGIKAMAFVHDSVEVAIPIIKEKQTKEIVSRIMKETMESVLGNKIPVGIDNQIADCWIK